MIFHILSDDVLQYILTEWIKVDLLLPHLTDRLESLFAIRNVSWREVGSESLSDKGVVEGWQVVEGFAMVLEVGDRAEFRV